MHPVCRPVRYDYQTRVNSVEGSGSQTGLSINAGSTLRQISSALRMRIKVVFRVDSPTILRSSVWDGTFNVQWILEDSRFKCLHIEAQDS